MTGKREGAERGNTPSVMKHTMWFIHYLLKCHETQRWTDRTVFR
jgi:hypothetical protein